MVSSEHADPSLINGGAYFVHEVPFKAFLDEFDKKIKQKACSLVSSTTCASIYLSVFIAKHLFEPEHSECRKIGEAWVCNIWCWVS